MKQRMHEIKIRLNNEELAHLNSMVERTIFSREHFIRSMLAGYQLSERPQVEVPQLIVQVRHVGVTLKLIEAIRALPKAARPRQVLGCEVWRDLDWMTGGQGATGVA